jgi:hypothetical protein
MIPHEGFIDHKFFDAIAILPFYEVSAGQQMNVE